MWLISLIWKTEVLWEMNLLILFGSIDCFRIAVRLSADDLRIFQRRWYKKIRGARARSQWRLFHHLSGLQSTCYEILVRRPIHLSASRWWFGKSGWGPCDSYRGIRKTYWEWCHTGLLDRVAEGAADLERQWCDWRIQTVVTHIAFRWCSSTFNTCSTV